MITGVSAAARCVLVCEGGGEGGGGREGGGREGWGKEGGRGGGV